MRIPFSSLACLALFCNASALADYAHDPAWPGNLPNDWVLGSASGAETGAYMRRWGAYGQVPAAPGENADVSDTFPIAHGIARADDGRIYVVDRGGTRYGARLQQFLGSGEYLLELDRPSMDVALSRDDDQRLLYIPGLTGDASEDQSIFVVDRATDEAIDRFRIGPVGHQVAGDDGGNVYVTGLDLTGLSRYRKTN